MEFNLIECFVIFLLVVALLKAIGKHHYDLEQRYYEEKYYKWKADYMRRNPDAFKDK